MKKIVKELTGLSLKELVEKYSKKIIKNGSLIIKSKRGIEIVGIRNTRDKKWFIELLIDNNCTNQSCNYGRYRIAKGSY